MSMEARKVVVVVQDATRDVSWSAIRWALHGLSLQPGDELILLGIVHQVINPSTLSFMGAKKLLGYRCKVDSSMFGVNPKFVEEEVNKKREEYYKNEEMAELFEQCEMKKIKFRIEWHAGSSPKSVAVQAAKDLKPTWVILDRQMKKDKKYFLEKLSCGISRMKRDNTIDQLRGPKETENIGYGEMIPGYRKHELSPKKSPNFQKATLGKERGSNIDGAPPWDSYQISPLLSTSWASEQISTTTVSSSSFGYTEVSSLSFGNTEVSSSSFFTDPNSSPVLFHDEENITTSKQEIEEERSPYQDRGDIDTYDTCNIDEQQKQHEINSDWMGGATPEDVFENGICSVCNNRRPKIGWKQEFTYAELYAATEGFSMKNFLSEGGFGSVYRGELKNGLKIAVKQHKDASFQGENEFKNEVDVLSRVRHQNLVMLLGSCSEGSHRLLVYEYVCGGSLDQHLSKHTRTPLSWKDRIKIALGAANGLEYLHQNNVIHRDMRPSNILVTHDYQSLLGDFGLARTHYGGSDDYSETRVVGTFGYLAPEYAESGKVSTKTDVYSFGVVLLQLITGLTTTDKIPGGESLVGWARPLLKDRNYPSLVDPRIIDFDVHQLLWMVRVASKCLIKESSQRITMPEVLNLLNYVSNGSTIGCIIDFSPAKSDSVNSSAPESHGSQEEAGTNEKEKRITELSDVNNTNQISEPPSIPSVTQAMFPKRSSISLFFGEGSGSSGRKSRERKRATTLTKGGLVFYNEMVPS